MRRRTEITGKPEIQERGPTHQRRVVGGVEQGVVKDVFVLDFGSTKLPDKFVNQLSLYNARHESHIKELWVFDSEGFHQIVLK